MEQSSPLPLTLATRNAGKVAELRAFLSAWIRVQGLEEAGYTALLEEPFDTFRANAEAKAAAVQRAVGGLVLADDSGLCVDALSGAPGVWSARYAGPSATDEQNIQKLLNNMAHVNEPQRTAHFVAVLCLAGSGNTQFFEGRCFGRIGLEQQGRGGFGYDPVFIPDGDTRSMAQLSREEKGKISHRGSALRALVLALENKYQQP